MKSLGELLEEDRSDRSNRDRYFANWKAISHKDDLRRKRVLRLLRQRQVTRPRDLFAAAFILHHGKEIEDFALASLLAMTAHERGFQELRNEPSALWLARAASDRFLVNIGLPQVHGTQFISPERLRSGSKVRSKRPLASK